MYTNEEEQDKWIDWCTEQLFTQTKGSQNILSQMHDAGASLKSKSKIEAVNKIITYYHNNNDRMQYKYYLSMNYPIGSGITEAACKVIVKQRLSCSGMRWTRTSADDILLARGLLYSDGRWRQFWQKIDQYGV